MGEGLELPECYRDLSLAILSRSTQVKLAMHLDPLADIIKDDGYTPDFLGLAELAGFDPTFIRYLESKPNKTLDLLDNWRSKQNGTVGNLVAYLTTLGREDCLTDITPFLVRDIKNHQKRSTSAENCGNGNFVTETKKLNTELNVEVADDIDNRPKTIKSPVSMAADNALTSDDVCFGGTTTYTACICCADEDLDIARVIVDRYSDMTSSIKFFIPQNQLLAATYQYESTAEVIEDRCDGRVIVIMSKNYVNSPACLFSTQFAKSLDPDARNRRIIPIIKDENVSSYPRILKGITALKLQRLKYGNSFWMLLSASLSIPYVVPLSSVRNSDGSSSSSNRSSSNSSSSNTTAAHHDNCKSLENITSVTTHTSYKKEYPSSSFNISVSETSTLRARSYSVESNESCTDNEEVNVQNSTHAHNNVLRNKKEGQQTLIVLPTREAYFNIPNLGEVLPDSGTNSEKPRNSESGATGCSNCSQQKVTNSGKRVLTKLFKSLKIRKKVKQTYCECRKSDSCSSLPVSFESERCLQQDELTNKQTINQVTGRVSSIPMAMQSLS